LTDRASPLDPLQYTDLVRAALAEDLGDAGDVTTRSVLEPDARATGTFVARQEGRVAGLAIALTAFHILEEAASEPERVRTHVWFDDGSDVAAGTDLARIEGSAATILSGERVALNLLGRLSGIATATREAVKAVAPYGTRVVDTRKTTPLLRAIEKYAVRVGGGHNHRFGLYDAILIKDNHAALAGGSADAVRRARAASGHMIRIEVEVQSLDQIESVLEAGADTILLDNMSPETLAEAVKLIADRAVTEASGGITLANAALVAASGVDVVSLGWLTHSAPALDVSLEIAKD
jgi:nicotinate-nucleotide pyrophosphorylase (carboxylating)